MKSNIFILCAVAICLFLFAGCNPKQTEEKQSQAASKETVADEEQVEPVEQEEPEQEEEQDDKSEEEPEQETESDKVESDIRLGDYAVFLGGEMIETEDKIIINGESNLIPGARVVGEVSVGDEKFFADTTELVQEDGSFHMEIAYQNLNEATKVAVKFHFDSPQDDAVIRHYGDRGQKLEGPYVYQHQRAAGGRSPKDIYQKAEVTATFEPGEEMAIRQFQEPALYPIPEDLGDPRVWIEVDDINNDENYFYLHGRSNLLEGSKIRGSYYFKNDETIVRPDGSFDLKIEYEYRENTPFVIEFKPDNLQWNIVEETYGKEGQKLVGELVVTNQYNKRQSIEKTVELQSNEINVPDNVELKIEGTEVTMLVPDNLLFDFDKYELKSEAKATLNEISATLQSFNKEIDIVINGYTDNVGDEKYNLGLSEKGAEEVKTYLVNQSQLKDTSFSTKGFGETNPIASNEDEAGQAKNRRVEIVINLR